MPHPLFWPKRSERLIQTLEEGRTMSRVKTNKSCLGLASGPITSSTETTAHRPRPRRDTKYGHGQMTRSLHERVRPPPLAPPPPPQSSHVDDIHHSWQRQTEAASARKTERKRTQERGHSRDTD